MKVPGQPCPLSGVHWGGAQRVSRFLSSLVCKIQVADLSNKVRRTTEFCEWMACSTWRAHRSELLYAGVLLALALSHLVTAERAHHRTW